MEDPATSVDCDGNWLLGNYGLHSRRRLRPDADVSFQSNFDGLSFIVGAFAVSSNVWPVFFAVDLVVHGILVNIKVHTSAASSVLSDAGNHLLLREVE